jgi:hypothetical protein
MAGAENSCLAHDSASRLWPLQNNLKPLQVAWPHSCPIFVVRDATVLSSQARDSYSSCCTNGLAIDSLPSTGLTSTRSVPLATTNPNDRVVSFPSSSTNWVSGYK